MQITFSIYPSIYSCMQQPSKVAYKTYVTTARGARMRSNSRYPGENVTGMR